MLAIIRICGYNICVYRQRYLSDGMYLSTWSNSHIKPVISQGPNRWGRYLDIHWNRRRYQKM